MNCRRQALQFCLDPAVVVVIQICNEFLLEVFHGTELLQIQQLTFEQPEGACSGCLRLAKERAEEVDILQLGVGLFADKAVIKKTNGALATVPMSELTIID